MNNEKEFQDWINKLDAEYEEYQASRNQPISKLPEHDQEIRIKEGIER